MKTMMKYAGVLGLFTLCGVAVAEQDQCPQSLTVEQIYDCIVEQGAGGSYTLPEASEQQAANHQEQNTVARLAAVATE